MSHKDCKLLLMQHQSSIYDVPLINCMSCNLRCRTWIFDFFRAVN